MSQETQAFNEEMVKKFNSIINNSDKFLGPSTKSTSTAPSESTLITSVKDTRDKISETMDIFKNYYIGQYTNAEWEKLNKGPYGVPLLLVTGIEPDKKSKPIIPSNLTFLETTDYIKYRVSPTFYDNSKNIYLKNVNTSLDHYKKLTQEHSNMIIPNMNELYKILNIDFVTQLDKKVNTSGVNERKTYYERQETDKMKFNIDALRKLYIRIFLILIFIKLYVYFLKSSISIRGVFIELILLLFLFVSPILLATLITIYTPKYLFEYLPSNVWVKNVE